MKKYLLAFTMLILLVSVNLMADEWTENFDDQTSTSYTSTSYVINSRTWTCKDAGNFAYANTNMASYAFTINDDKAGAHVTTPALNTIGTVSFKYAYINGSDTNVFQLQKSYTNGNDFVDIDTHTLGSTANLTYVDYSFDVNDSASEVYIRVLSDYKNAHLFIEDFSVTNFSAGENILPSITNVIQTPNTNIISSTTVSVSADITDSDGTIIGAELHWGTSTGSLSNIIDMSVSTGDNYVTDSDIPAQLNGVTVYYEIYALDSDDGETTTSEYSYLVADPQPPVADFEASKTEVIVDEIITFTNLSTDGVPEFTYAWDFDNDGSTDSTDENPNYSYSSIGTYTVKLTVIDGNTDSDIETKVDYITVTEAPNVASDLFFSEYIEGGSFNKAIEIFNGTGAPVDLSIYTIKYGANGAALSTTYTLSSAAATLASNDVLVLAHGSANATILAAADDTPSIINHNGDDAYGLFKNGVLIDVIGEPTSPAASWAVAGTSGATKDHTLVRKSSIFGPTTDWSLSAGTDATDSQWIVYAQDESSYIGAHDFDGTGIIAGTVATPVISPEAGDYINEVEITISCETVGATIYYTTNGIDPTTGSTEYSGAFTLTSGATVKAFAVKDGDTDSFIAEAIFTISAPDPLVADFTANTTSITVGQEVSFTNLTTGGVPDYLYSWDLDGDGNEDSDLSAPSFIYNTVGTYTVELLIYDSELNESTQTKVDYIEVFASAVEPTVGSLFISEVSDAATFNNEYIELYNNSSELLTLANITLRMDLTVSDFQLSNVSYIGDRTIQPNSFMIITRGGSKALFESEFGSLPAGVNFLQGDGNMFFGTSSARRWQLILNSEAKAETIIDDTVELVGGSGNTSYQSSPGVWVTDVLANNTPGGPTGDQTLPVTFASFMAIQTSENFAELTWVTYTESGVSGYNVLRNLVEDEASSIRINSDLIEATNTTTNTTYTYTDTETEMNTTYYYWLESTDFDGTTLTHGPVSIRLSQDNDTPEIVIPTKTSLRNVYPNPFNPSTTVNFYMDKADDVKINVYNVKGQLINVITEDRFDEGFHNVTWNGTDLKGNDCASGIYFFRMETRTEKQMVKGILMK